jgi:glycosyltransferase involved in cell wall biosynthesis
MLRPGITLAMIVRNGAATLERCLASAREAVDEIAVVDTGSADGSPGIAQRLGAQVRQMEWPGAFDAARNASLEMVQTEWMLWLDADEWLVDGAAQEVRKAVGQAGAFGFLLVRRDLYPDGGFAEQHQFRLWRHHPELRFQGVIHEQIPLAEFQERFPGLSLSATKIAFWHDGYLPHLSQEKARRNLPLLEREAQRRADTVYFEIERVQTLKTLGEPSAAKAELALADRLAELGRTQDEPDNTAALFLMRYLADLPEDRLWESRTDALMRLGQGWFPDHPGVRFLIAQVLVRRNDLRGALAHLLAVERMAETGEYDRLTSTNPVMLGAGLSRNLAWIAQQLGMTPLAQKHAARLARLENVANSDTMQTGAKA